MQQPIARVDSVRDTYFGTTLEDPYRWMEHWRSEEVQAWVKGQAASMRAHLDALAGREKLLARITELSNPGPELSAFQVMSERVFYLRRNPGEDLAKLVVRLPDGQEKTLFNPNLIGGEAQTGIDWYFPSPARRSVTSGISQGSSGNVFRHVVEAA